VSDLEAKLIGVWRLLSIERGGRKISGGLSHLVVRRAFLFETDAPAKASKPRGYRAEVVGPTTLRIEVDHERRGTLHALLELEGDVLRWRWGAPDGEAPPSIEGRGDLERLVRESDVAVAREASGRGPGDRRAVLTHPLLGTLTHEGFRDVWAGARFAFEDRICAVELPGDARLSPAALESLVSRLHDVPLRDLALAARGEWIWLADQLEDDPPEGQGPLHPTRVELLEKGVVVHFSEGLAIETDEAFQIVDVVSEAPQTGEETGEEPGEAANDAPPSRTR
jgi:hypothetical protein